VLEEGKESGGEPLGIVGIPTNQVLQSNETTSRQLWVLDATTGRLSWWIRGNLIAADGSTAIVEGSPTSASTRSRSSTTTSGSSATRPP
jgi:hypothetical protein